MAVPSPDGFPSERGIEGLIMIILSLILYDGHGIDCTRNLLSDIGLLGSLTSLSECRLIV
jgi:hypothetical protein